MSIRKVLLGIILVAFCSAANAVQVLLVSHEYTSISGFVNVYITDGSSHLPPSTAVWDWDGTTLSSTGTYNGSLYYANNPAGSAVTGDTIVNLSINTATSTATAASFRCTEGTFLSSVGASGCGNYSFGTNFINESTTTWGPGTNVSQILGGDDVSGGPAGSIADYGYGLMGFSGTGMNVGDFVMLGNGIAIGTADAELMTFEVVASALPEPAVVLLFGSSLGLIGWMRRKTG